MTKQTQWILAAASVVLVVLGIVMIRSFLPAPAAPVALPTNTPVAPATRPAAGVPPTAQPVATATAPSPSATPSPDVSPSATTRLRLAIADTIEGSLRVALEAWGKDQNLLLVPQGTTADLVVGTEQAAGATLLAERFYAAVDWFPTKRSGISLEDLKGLWQGRPTADGLSILLVGDETAGALAALWGAPAASVERLRPEEITTRLWTEAGALAVVPFDQLTPRLTLLPIDGQSLLERALDVSGYPLVVRTWVSGDATLAPAMVEDIRPRVALTNRDTNRLTTLMMTGVTAMGRTTAWKIEQKQDPAYPARQIADVLSAADITHISNEIPFVDDCQPSLEPNLLILCSKPSYMAAIKLVGADIIGLTGNHMLDYGPEAFLKTLDLYDQNNLKYYAGGHNATEAAQPLYLVDHGNKLAFLGANSFGPPSDWATDDQPGAQRYDLETMNKEIEAARQQADVVLVEYQAEETYEYTPSLNNSAQFRASLAAGADIVTGVQAHQPQAVEFSQDGRGIILYGLGNLFFDQMFDENVRQGLIPRHTIYEGRLLQTELLTTMLEDYAQPRWATPEERARILQLVFDASGFK